MKLHIIVFSSIFFAVGLFSNRAQASVEVNSLMGETETETVPQFREHVELYCNSSDVYTKEGVCSWQNSDSLRFSTTIPVDNDLYRQGYQRHVEWNGVPTYQRGYFIYLPLHKEIRVSRTRNNDIARLIISPEQVDNLITIIYFQEIGLWHSRPGRLVLEYSDGKPSVTIRFQ